MQTYRRPSRWRAVGAVVLGLLLVLTSAATVVLAVARVLLQAWMVAEPAVAAPAAP